MTEKERADMEAGWAEMDLQLQREYVEDQVKQAGLTGTAAQLAIDSAMSIAEDIESDDDFERQVAAIIEGAADAAKGLPPTTVKFPHVSVKLVGTDGNAFAIIGTVSSALRRAKVPDADVREFQREATSGDYNHVLCTCMNWVNVR